MGKSKPQSKAAESASVPPEVAEGVGKVPTRDDMHGSTSKLFIKGLPEDATGEDLEMFFSEVGPVKRCFVVTEKGSSKCKGIGYVHFAFGEDADKAIKVMKNQKFRGRALTITHAKKRQARSEREDIQKELREGKVAEFVGERDDLKVSETPKAPEKPSKIRKNALKDKREGKEKREERTKAPIKDNIEVEKKKVAARVVVIRGVEEGKHTPEWIAKELSPFGRITAISYPAPETAYVLFISPEAAVAAVSKLSVHFKESPLTVFLFSGALLKQFRLIVRNLPFKATLADVEEKFAPYGPLYEVQVPKGKKPGMNRGFAFVNYTNVNDATKAVESVNMKEICGRPVAVDFALAKSEFDTLEKKAAPTEEPDAPPASEKSEENEVESEDGKEEGEESYEDDDASSWTSSNEEEESGDESDIERPRTPQDSDVTKGQTLFIRNLSYETKEEEIRAAFQKFGSIIFVKLVRDKETGAPRSRESAEKALEEAYESQKYTKLTLSNRQRKKAKSRHDTESDIIVDGRRVMVALAVEKDQAQELSEKQRLTESGKKERGKDRRNLYLAEIGVIKPDDPEAEKMPAIEVQKRLRAWQEKKLKLANPNFHVSPTRLAVRGLPKELTEADLREVFRKAAADSGLKSPPAIKQVKIVRDPNMSDAEGNSLSRGFGFVEFKHHEHALAALHNTNNKRDAYLVGIIPHQKTRTLIVDFAVENSKNLEIMRQKQAATNERSRQRQGEMTEESRLPVKRRREDQEESRPAKRTNVDKSGPTDKKTTPRGDVEKEASPIERNQNNNKKREREWNSNKNEGKKAKRARIEPSPRAPPSRPTPAPRTEVKPQKKKTDPGLHNLSRKEVRQEQTFEALVSSYKNALGARPLKKKWDE